MSLDDLNGQPWDQTTLDGLDKWQQGHIVETGSRLFWTAPGGRDVVTGTDGGDPASTRVLGSAAAHTTELSVITSQTCDVIGNGQGRKHPWVQVSPICEITDPNVIANVQNGRLLSQFLVTADLGREGTFAVDLRFTHPVSKAVLLDQTPRHAFVSEVDRCQFAERLAAKVGRASLHDLLAGSLAQALSNFVLEEQKLGEWDGLVEQFRVVIIEGTRLEPRRVRLLAVTENPPGSSLTKKIDKCVEGWKKANRQRLRSARIDVESTQVRSLENLDVRVYRDSAHLPVEAVTRRFWF